MSWKILYTNPASLTAKYDDLLSVVSLLKPSIILLAETWLKPHILDSLIHIPNFSLYRHDRLTHTSGGVCVYVNDDILSEFSIKQIDFTCHEVDTIALQFSCRNFNATIACVYRPRYTSFNNNLILFDKIEQLSKNDNFVLVGDFNFSELKWPINRTVQPGNASSHFVDLIQRSSLHQLITDYTRYREGQQPSVLDLLLTNDLNLLTPYEICAPIGKSDHVSMVFTMQFYVDIPFSKNQNQIMKITDYQAVAEELKSIDWRCALDPDDPDQSWQSFHSRVSECLLNHTCEKKVFRNTLKPWIGADILQMIKNKRNLWKKFRRTKRDEDYRRHRQYSQEVSDCIRDARSAYEVSVVDNPNRKKIFKHVRRALKSSVQAPLLRKPDGSMCTNSEEVAELFSTTFSEVFTIETSPVAYPIVRSPRVNDSLCDLNFEPDNISHYIQKIKLDCAPGLDGLTARFFRNCAESICVPLSIIMDSCFRQSVLPAQWLKASVTPVYKKGDKLDPNNYRPISLTSIACKVMESVISEQIRNFALVRGIIPREQHGFVPGRSIITNLLTCVNDWSLLLDTNTPVDVVYLDFSKAFDRVPKLRLLHKLEHLGIRGNLLKLINAFLSNRSFLVRVGDSFSEPRRSVSGVPQGSVLGPLLFLLYTSDIVHHIRTGCSLYADDTKLYANPLSESSKLQEDLNEIVKWSQDWMLPINASKCVVLHMGKNNPKTPYHMCGLQLRIVQSHVDLGVVITEDLSWSSHISYVCKKANSTMYLLRKAFREVSFDAFIKLYKCYVRPILEFAGPVWCAELVRDKNALESVQRRATRLPFRGSDRPPYEQRMTMAHLKSFESRKLRGDLIITYRAMNNLFSVDISNLFPINDDIRLRRHPFKLKKERFLTSSRQNFISNRVFSLWNSLPADVVCAPSVNTFKNRFDEMQSR